MATADELQYGLTLLAAVGSALIGGVFFAFSTFIMRALARLPAAAGIAAMQQINVAVINPWFLVPFVGTAVAGVALAVWGVVVWGGGYRSRRRRNGAWGGPSPWPSPWEGEGTGCCGDLYVVGTFLVTMRCNVAIDSSLCSE